MEIKKVREKLIGINHKQTYTHGVSQEENQNERTEQIFKNRIQGNISKNKIRHESIYLKDLPCTWGNLSRKGNIET